MAVRANALLPHLQGLRARLGAERRRTAALAARVGLKAEGPEQSVWQLSGGNQQKVVFARAMAATPRLLLLDEPTRGVDVGARHEIYRLIRGLSADGCAVLMASSDLPELLGLCDRILLMNQGRQADTIDAAGLTASDLLQAIYAQGAESRAV
jgi:ABC-type sugar transport system ATPase subunit